MILPVFSFFEQIAFKLIIKVVKQNQNLEVGKNLKLAVICPNYFLTKICAKINSRMVRADGSSWFQTTHRGLSTAELKESRRC